MNFQEQLDDILLEKPQRMGSFAVQMDHPGLMKSLKKKKTTKADRSFFANDEDASKQYITGTMDASGRAKKSKKSKIGERISRRLESLDGR